MDKSGAVRPARRSAAEWSALVSDFEVFSGTMTEFCRRSGISRRSLTHWRRRFREQAFVEIAAPPSSSSSPSPCWDVELDLGDGTVLRVRRRPC